MGWGGGESLIGIFPYWIKDIGYISICIYIYVRIQLRLGLRLPTVLRTYLIEAAGEMNLGVDTQTV